MMSALFLCEERTFISIVPKEIKECLFNFYRLGHALILPVFLPTLIAWLSKREIILWLFAVLQSNNIDQ